MPAQLDPEGVETRALFDLVPTFVGQRVLEIGCGDGRLTQRYASGAARVTAIDPDADKVAAAKTSLPLELNSRVEFLAADLEQFNFQHGGGERYDLAILAWSL